MIRPTLEEAMQYQKDYKVVPVLKEIYSDIRTPMQVLKILKKASKHCYMLESVENQENWGRYTFLGYKPKLCVTCMNGKLKVTDVNGTVIREVLVQHPEACINESWQITKARRSKDSRHSPVDWLGILHMITSNTVNRS